MYIYIYFFDNPYLFSTTLQTVENIKRCIIVLKKYFCMQYEKPNNQYLFIYITFLSINLNLEII